jgi:YaiO family outer membrane protein
MTISQQRRRQFAAVFLFLSLVIAPGLRAQDSAVPPGVPASANPALVTPASSSSSSSNITSDNPVQASPQQPNVDIPLQLGPKQLTNFVEAGSDYLGLDNNFGSWAGGYARGVVTKGSNIWSAEVNGQREFGDAGVYFAAGDTYNFNPDWYGSATVGSSVGGFFWPRFRADGFINKKWMARKQLITTFGLGYYAAKDVHRDHSFFVGSTYYFTKPWILEEGIRFNVSNPGSVFSPAGFVAVTQGRNQRHYLTFRAGFGKEAYQLVGPTVTLTNFDSQTFTFTWRQWLGTNWGINMVGDSYHSPFYARGGASFGFFREF